MILADPCWPGLFVGALELIEFLVLVVQNSRTVRAPAGIKAQEVRSFYPRSKRAHLVHGRTVDDHLTRSLGKRYFDMESHCAYLIHFCVNVALR
jgi:hypothetical protein